MDLLDLLPIHTTPQEESNQFTNEDGDNEFDEDINEDDDINTFVYTLVVHNKLCLGCVS
ncbi:hypothetical protein MtrunA17_Chr1g0211021 [Medicago truncatula]|uniref:Uncharacterized protein n=1 Tax=Medicago truncatula TaxID=3880 RepID=A0A396K3T9_MEDTR|nr:hypothetical protein MtrunA17_Chr1g0211021 [Medicago truncatula]